MAVLAVWGRWSGEEVARSSRWLALQSGRIKGKFVSQVPQQMVVVTSGLGFGRAVCGEVAVVLRHAFSGQLHMVDFWLLFSVGHVADPCLFWTPQWGTTDAEIKDLSVEKSELKGSPYKAWSRSVNSHACYAYCQGFLPCLFLPSGPFICIFPKPLPIFSFLCRPAE